LPINGYDARGPEKVPRGGLTPADPRAKIPGMKKMKPLPAAILCLALSSCSTAGTRKNPGEDKTNPQYFYDRAVVAARYSLTGQAIEYLDQALALDPNHVPSLNLLGLIHFQAKDFGKAAAVLEKCVGLKPDLIEAANRLGQTYEALGEKDKAEEQFRKSLEVDGNGFAAFSLAKILMENKKYPEALEFVERSIQKADKEAGAYNLKGVVLNQMGRYQDSITALRTGLALAPKDANIRINLGVALINSKDYAQAKEVLEKALPLIKDPALRARVEGFLKSIADAEK
jgi:tetratricopeptide (TPR) repeat protein